MPRHAARLLVPFMFVAAVGCSTINLKGGSTAAKWRDSDDSEVRSQPGSVTVTQPYNGKGYSFDAHFVPTSR